MKTLVVILGPTAVGKTEISLRLAENLSSPIISADSRQIYQGIPIGTAAPNADELQRVRHYFVGTLNLNDYYSAAQYETDALKVITKEFQHHDVLVMSGGSMFYIDAVCRGIDDIPTVTPDIRKEMRNRLEREGLNTLADELRQLDPAYFAGCDIRNPKRVVHALEICHMSGRPYSTFLSGCAKQRPFRVVRIGLQRERAELFERIGLRVDEMIREGLLEEARSVLPFRATNALNTVGYKELFNYFDGTWTLDYAIEKIKRNTRVYAKKQMTWFNKDLSTTWFSPDAYAEIRKFITSIL